MKISDIRMFLLRPPRGNLHAIATVTFDQALVVSDFRILEKHGRWFVGMPGRKNRQGEYVDTVFPIDNGLMDSLQRLVLRAFQDEQARFEGTGF